MLLGNDGRRYSAIKQRPAEAEKRILAHPSLYAVLIAAIVILTAATGLWLKSNQEDSRQSISDLCRFYLEEITERNAGSILSELVKKTDQMTRALTVLDSDSLQSEEALRRYLSQVQSINGLDMFAMADENGMIYTADNTFSGISRFSFLSEAATEAAIHVVKSYGSRAMVIIEVPLSREVPAGIPVVSCMSGLDMPHMDGYEATRQIRRLPDPEIAKLPILVMTANAFEEDRQNAIAAGMNGHIAKPIEIPRLTEMLQKYLH